MVKLSYGQMKRGLGIHCRNETEVPGKIGK